MMVMMMMMGMMNIEMELKTYLFFPLRCDLPDSLNMNRSNIFFIFPRCTCAILCKRSELPLPRHIMAHRWPWNCWKINSAHLHHARVHRELFCSEKFTESTKWVDAATTKRTYHRVIWDMGTRRKENKDPVENCLVRLVETRRVLKLSLWYSDCIFNIHVLKSGRASYNKVKPC